MSGMRKKRKLLFVAATVAICGTLAIGMKSEAPLILYPITPSLPPGLYTRTFELPKVDMIAAFRVPKAAKRYKESIGEYVNDDFLFIKPIIAGPGDHVCHRSVNRVLINGINVAGQSTSDHVDRQRPPLWQICRSLVEDEFFVLSTHLPNSFDSRSFGPIRLSEILGLYRSLIPSLGMARL